MSEEKGFVHRRSNDFGKVPHVLMTDTNISAGAVRLYAYMHWRYGSNHDNHEGRASMAEALGVSKKTITTYAQELEQADWIVIIPRKSDKGSATNFYHVFEIQEDCLIWRAEKKRPKPERTIKERKGRKGIGGKPSHNNVNSSSLSKPISDDVNSSSPTPVNSSSHNPDSYDPEKKLADTPSGGQRVEDESATTESRRDRIFECVVTRGFGVPLENEAGVASIRDKANWITSWLKGNAVKKNSRDRNRSLPGCNPPMQEPELNSFYGWWERDKGIDKPHTALGMAQFVAVFRQQKTGRPATNATPKPHFPAPVHDCEMCGGTGQLRDADSRSIPCPACLAAEQEAADERAS